MRISIAMATYNGARYLEEQLNSFLHQLLAPDELVVCDDCSQDRTVELLNNFRRNAPFPVRVFANDRNLGLARNFDKALSLCNGDVIFLSDQDDVWFNNKISRVVQCLADHPNAWLVVNDAEIADEALRPRGVTVRAQTLSVGSRESDYGHGSAMALRRQLCDVACPIPYKVANHDSWLNNFANLLGCRFPLCETLQHWRRHAENTSSWICSRQKRVTKIDLWYHLVQRGLVTTDSLGACERRLDYLHEISSRLADSKCSQILPVQARDRAIEQVNAAIFANRARSTLLREGFFKRVPKALRFYFSGGYRNFEGLLSLGKDIVLKNSTTRR